MNDQDRNQFFARVHADDELGLFYLGIDRESDGERVPVLNASNIDALNSRVIDLVTPSGLPKMDSPETDSPANQYPALENTLSRSLEGNPFNDVAMERMLLETGIMNKGDSLYVNSGNFGYFVNLDERGLFNADVRDHAEMSVFTIVSMDQLNEMIDDGFLRHTTDTDGLFDYLVSRDILNNDDELHDAKTYEQVLNDHYSLGLEIAQKARLRDAIYNNVDYTRNSNAEVAVNLALPSVTIALADDPDEQVLLTEHEAEPFIDQANEYFKEADVPIQDAYEAVAAQYVETMTPAPEDGPGPG